MRDGVKLACDMILPAKDGIAVSDPLSGETRW